MDNINASGSNYGPTNTTPKYNINASPNATPTNTGAVNRFDSEQSDTSGNFGLNK